MWESGASASPAKTSSRSGGGAAAAGGAAAKKAIADGIKEKTKLCA